MRISTAKYHLRQGISGLMKNSLMSIASIATVTACAFILIITLCIVINLDYILEQIETTIGISVFIGDELEQTQVDYLKSKISGIENVNEVKFLSEEDALKWAEDTWGESGMLEGLEDDNPFPRSFDITLNGARYQKDVIKSLEKLQLEFENTLVNGQGDVTGAGDITNVENETGQQTQTQTTVENQTVQDNLTQDETVKIGEKDYEFKGIERIRHAQRESEILLTINAALRIIGLVLIIVMAIISVGIIMNTIKITVFIRKNEIGIMKYVGATDWFIRWPFVIEGLIIGLVGALIPSIICWIGYDKSIVLINEKIIVLQQFAQLKTGSEIFFIIMPITLLVGASLGAFGSITSIRKHLNV